MGRQLGQGGADHLRQSGSELGQGGQTELGSEPGEESAHLWVVLEHELVSGQEVLLGEQLHVLADVLHKLHGVRLWDRNSQNQLQVWF